MIKNKQYFFVLLFFLNSLLCGSVSIKPIDENTQTIDNVSMYIGGFCITNGLLRKTTRPIFVGVPLLCSGMNNTITNETRSIVNTELLLAREVGKKHFLQNKNYIIHHAINNNQSFINKNCGYIDNIVTKSNFLKNCILPIKSTEKYGINNIEAITSDYIKSIYEEIQSKEYMKKNNIKDNYQKNSFIYYLFSNDILNDQRSQYLETTINNNQETIKKEANLYAENFLKQSLKRSERFPIAIYLGYQYFKDQPTFINNQQSIALQSFNRECLKKIHFL
jgi:hypothetical protein